MSNQIMMQNWLINQLAEQLSLNPLNISTTEPLTRYGLDSIDAVTMVGDIEDVLDQELPSTLFWDYPTIEKSAQFLADNYDLSAIGSSTSSLKGIANNVSIPTPEAQPEMKVAATAPSSTSKWGGLFGRKNS